ncbi:MAG: hypothetical protein J7J14_00045 [Thermotogaceae bacterium]|nr:hypothetical protein [Thermotogaceae bacterium]
MMFVVSFSNTFFVSNSGVLYYLGDSTPTSMDMDVINDWKKLPVLFLMYDGPYEHKEIVESILKKRGYLLGYGEKLVVKIRTHRNVFVYQIIYGDTESDNFLSPSPLEEMDEVLDKAISEILPKIELPKKLFLVYYDPKSGKLVKTIEKTEKVVEDGFTPSPVIIRISGEKFYKVKIGDVEKELEEGFHIVSGKLIYVGRNLKLKNLMNFFPDVEGVFPRESDMIFYQKGFLIFPDGNVLKTERPVDVVEDSIILSTGILKGGKLKRAEGTILWVEDGFILTSRGELEDLALTWSFKVSSVPKEWCFKGNFFYILDICGFLRKYDLKQRKLIWEKRVEGAWGMDVSDEGVMVGVKNGILVLNNQNGSLIKKIDGEDFSYWEDEGLLIYKDKMINGEYVGEGYFLRCEGIPVFVREDGSAVVFGDRKYKLQKVREIIRFSWGVEIVTEEGTWLIEKRR